MSVSTDERGARIAGRHEMLLAPVTRFFFDHAVVLLESALRHACRLLGRRGIDCAKGKSLGRKIRQPLPGHG
jgi:hypothetical protein